MKRIRGRLGACVLLAVLVWSVVPASLQALPGGCVKTFSGLAASSCSTELSWRFSRGTNLFEQSGQIRGNSAMGVRYEYQVLERCLEGMDCGGAHLCPTLGGLSGRSQSAFAFFVLPNGLRSPTPTSIELVCVYPGRSVALAVVQAAVHEEVRKRIPSPTVVSAPPGVSLVNLLTIFSTTPAAEQVISFTVPVPGEVRAVPEYTWDFGDGIQGVGPGRPFTSSVLPSANPGYYTGATYSRPGMKHVTLTVTWRVTFRLEGVQDIPLDPIVMMASEDKQITTARAVLVN